MLQKQSWHSSEFSFNLQPMWYLVVKPGKQQTHMAVHGVMRDPLWHCWWGQGLSVTPRGCQPSDRALLRLQLFICISIKASWDNYKETSFPTEISKSTPPVTRSSSCTRVCVWHWNYKYCLNKPLGDTWPSHNGVQGLGHSPHLDPLPRKGPCECRLAKNQLIDQNQQKVSCSFREPGVFHLWFPNCPDTGRSRTFCNSFIWFLFGIICPFSSVCCKVFHITSDILSFHISCNIFIIFSWAITFWKQITFFFFS